MAIFSKQPKYDFVIFGLGNPGIEYDGTRHNIGFAALDQICLDNGIKLQKHKFDSFFGEGVIAGKKVLAVKPQTYMNASGRSVRLITSFYKIPADKILVLSDDVSLPAGKLRIRKKGSAGGHNGLKDIIAETGTEEILRIKIGVGEKPHPDYDLAKWVLGKFSGGDKKTMETACEKVSDAVKLLLTKGADAAMEKFNG